SNNKLPSFFTGFFLTLSLCSAAIAGLSDYDKFFPGFNDKDDTIDVSVILWLSSVGSLAVSLYSIGKIYQNNRKEEALRMYSGIEVEPVEQHQPINVNKQTYGTSGENINLLLRESDSSPCLAIGWGVLGFLLSGLASLVFLHVARHIAERDHNFSNST